MSAIARAALTVLIAEGPHGLLAQTTPAAPDKTIWLPIASSEAYIGAQQCGACHPSKLAVQRMSEHAHSLSRPASHALANKFVPSQTFVRGGRFAFQFSWDSNNLRVRALSDSQEITMPVEWAFGAGSQAVTFVSRANPEWYLEHSLSYYSAHGSYSNTPGHSILPENTLPASLGNLFRSDDPKNGVLHCFQCHSTGPVARDGNGELHPHELGVRCEACHGPGRAHRDAALSGDRARVKWLIENPKRLSTDQLNHFCGNCHRPPAISGTETDWSVPWNVRHQPVYLSESECFRKSHGALSCLTCHDPHTVLRTDASYYNDKCTSCHTRDQRPPNRTCLAAQPGNCVDCHMPRVSPQSYLRFTNHWIGVYEGQDKLKPLRRDGSRRK